MIQKLFLLALTAIVTSVSFSQTPGNALDFDGTNDYVSAALPTVFTDLASNDFTVETWIKDDGTGVRRVFYAQLNSSEFVSILISASNAVYAYVYDGSTYYSEKTPDMAASTWTHVAITWEASTSTILIYLNGVLTATTGGGSSTPSSVDNTMSIGVGYAVSNFEGEIDEFRVWDIVRSECEISGTFNSEFTVSQSNLVAYYNFNEGVAGGTNTGITTLPDFTTVYDGTLNSFTLTGSASNWIASGADITEADAMPGSSSTDVITTCDSITWLDGITYTSDNSTATHVMTDMDGCDSTITLNLTVNSIDNSVTLAGFTMSAVQTGATYQWVSCPAMTPISGATNQSYLAAADGDYAVIISVGGCSDTSSCVTIAGVGNPQEFSTELIQIYPNPTDGNFAIDLGEELSSVTVTISDLSGKIVQVDAYSNTQFINLEFDRPAGVYLLNIQSGNKNQVIQLIKE